MWSWVKTKKIFIYLQDDSFLRSILDLFKNWNGKEMIDARQKLLKLGTWIKYTVQSKDSEVLGY